jgi:hypothetical protein
MENVLDAGIIVIDAHGLQVKVINAFGVKMVTR